MSGYEVAGPSGQVYWVIPPGDAPKPYWTGTRMPEDQGVLAFAPSEEQLIGLLERTPPRTDGTYHTVKICTPEDWAEELEYREWLLAEETDQ